MATELTEVYLQGQGYPVKLEAVERDDDAAIVGTTPSGKRFATRKENVGQPIPKRHRFRVYTKTHGVLYVLDPAFEEVEAWFLGDGPGPLAITTYPYGTATLERDDVLSILSARPEDERSKLHAVESDEDETDEDEVLDEAWDGTINAEEPTGDPEVDAES